MRICALYVVEATRNAGDLLFPTIAAYIVYGHKQKCLSHTRDYTTHTYISGFRKIVQLKRVGHI